MVLISKVTYILARTALAHIDNDYLRKFFQRKRKDSSEEIARTDASRSICEASTRDILSLGCVITRASH